MGPLLPRVKEDLELPCFCGGTANEFSVGTPTPCRTCNITGLYPLMPREFPSQWDSRKPHVFLNSHWRWYSLWLRFICKRKALAIRNWVFFFQSTMHIPCNLSPDIPCGKADWPGWCFVVWACCVGNQWRNVTNKRKSCLTQWVVNVWDLLS